MIKTIFFLSPEVTGAERVSITLAKQLSKEEYDVSFVILGDTCGDIVSYIPRRYTFLSLPIHLLDGFLMKEQPQVVFCSLIHLNYEVLASARRVGNIKVVLRNNYLLKDVTEVLRQKAIHFYRKADTVIAQTDLMKSELMEECGVEEKRIMVIDNPIDKEYIDDQLNGAVFPYPDDDLFHFCWVGRYSRIKGVDTMLRAFGQAYQECPQMSLYLIGKKETENAYYQSVLKYVTENQLDKVVHFIGFDHNPYRWIKNADCLLVPSRSEASSNVLKEALYLETPIISTSRISVDSELIYYVPSEDIILMTECMLNQLRKQ